MFNLPILKGITSFLVSLVSISLTSSVSHSSATPAPTLDPAIVQLHDLETELAVTRIEVKLPRTLKRGSIGEDVNTLQNYLVKIDPMFKASGIGLFGPLTDKEVRQFQIQHGLDGSGIFDSGTRSVLATMLAPEMINTEILPKFPDLAHLDQLVTELQTISNVTQTPIPNTPASMSDDELNQACADAGFFSADSAIPLSGVSDACTALGYITADQCQAPAETLPTSVTPMPSVSRTPTPTLTPIPTATLSKTPTPTPSKTPTPAPTPSKTPTPTPTPSKTPTPTLTPSKTP